MVYLKYPSPSLLLSERMLKMENREYFVLNKKVNNVFFLVAKGKDRFDLLANLEREEGARYFLERFRDGFYKGGEEV